MTSTTTPKVAEFNSVMTAMRNIAELERTSLNNVFKELTESYGGGAGKIKKNAKWVTDEIRRLSRE